MTGQITRNTAIGGEHVAAGTVVEVDDATYRQLKACGKIRAAVTADAETEAAVTAKPKFTRVKKPAAE